MAQASFYCPHCQSQRLFRADEMSHTPHLLAAIFLCGLWLPIWLLLAISHSPRYHCSQCGYSDDIKYLANPNRRHQEHLREQHRRRQLDEKIRNGETVTLSDRIGAMPVGTMIGMIALGLIISVVGLGFLAGLFGSSTNRTVPNQPSVKSVPPVEQEKSGVEILTEVKAEIESKKGKMTDGDYSAVYMRLTKIKSNTAAYPEAQKILQENKKQIEKALKNVK